MRLISLALVACLPVATASADFRGVLVSGRLSYDVGNAYVPDTASGVGGGVGLRFLLGGRDHPLELGLELNLAGYESSGDGDAILTVSATIAWRRYLAAEGDGARPYWSVGTGWGGVFIAGSDEAAVPLRIALGISLARRNGIGLDVAVFNRLTLIPMGDFPGTKLINGTGIELAIRFGGRRIGR
jgi:hypothetical protein